jgi:glutathione S-transferase
MKLIYANGACSLSVHIMLRELDINFDASRVDLKDKRVLESYNPKSYVPALVLEDGTLLTEAISILQYLSESNGGVYMPVGSIQRAKCTGWLTYFSTELHKGVGPLFHKENITPQFESEVRQKIDKRLQFVDEALSESEFLMPEFTVADMYALAILRILEHVEVSLEGFHWISEYKKRLEARPVISDVIKQEERAKLETKLNPEPLHFGNRTSSNLRDIIT